MRLIQMVLFTLLISRTALAASGASKPRVVVKLIDSGLSAPPCGTLHTVVVMKYRVLKVIEGTFDGQDLYVAQSCPEFAIPKIMGPYFPGREFEVTLGSFDGQGALFGAAPGHSLYTVSDVKAVGPLLTPAAPLPASGLYERFSPLTLAPSGAIESTVTSRFPVWLSVTTTGMQTEIDFKPEGRIHWSLRYGVHGLEHKTTTVDGEVWTESEFIFDPAGHLAQKKVTGLGAPGGLEFTYKTGPNGEVLERTGKLPSKSGKDFAMDRVVVTNQGDEYRLEESVDGVVARIDSFDFAGVLRRSEFGKPASSSKHLVLRYDRDSTATLTSVQTFQGTEYPRKADWSHPAKDVTPARLALLGPLVERSEALLLLGAPVTHSVTGKGAARTITDVYFKECKLNETSSVSYYPSDLVVSAFATCICGFCVEGPAKPLGELNGHDEHWTAGPWIRLNGNISVTADHQVMTPSGPRKAGELKSGELVLDEGGQSVPLRQVEVLQGRDLKMGVNLRTSTGAFVAGGLRFASEPLKDCKP